jgi:hypothetical protein
MLSSLSTKMRGTTSTPLACECETISVKTSDQAGTEVERLCKVHSTPNVATEQHGHTTINLNGKALGASQVTGVRRPTAARRGRQDNAVNADVQGEFCISRMRQPFDQQCPSSTTPDPFEVRPIPFMD